MNDKRRKTLKEIAESCMDLQSELEISRDEEQESLDNLPEAFQEGEKGEKMQTAIDALEEALDNIQNAIDNIQTAIE